jgi:hypothetical protein
VAPRRSAGRWWALPLALLLAGPAAGLAAGAEDPQAASTAEEESGRPPYLGGLSIHVENDWFVNEDQNYTSGVGLSWTSDDVSLYGERNGLRKIVDAFSFLPRVGHPDFRGFVSFTLGQEMYTPEDIEAPRPPPDQHPYAGVLFLDTAIYAHGGRTMHAYTLRLGVVGPSSRADDVQTWVHENKPAPIPQGWDYQLDNEPLLNLNYQRYSRLARNVPEGKTNTDLSAHYGGGFGNYFIGASAGVIGRLGFALPDNFSVANLRLGGGSWLVGITPTAARTGWYGYGFLGLEGVAIARFLPTDGNTFQESASVDRENFVASVTTGVAFGRGSFHFSWSFNTLGELVESERTRSNDYGTFTFSWLVRMKRR